MAAKCSPLFATVDHNPCYLSNCQQTQIYLSRLVDVRSNWSDKEVDGINMTGEKVESQFSLLGNLNECFDNGMPNG